MSQQPGASTMFIQKLHIIVEDFYPQFPQFK